MYNLKESNILPMSPELMQINDKKQKSLKENQSNLSIDENIYDDFFDPLDQPVDIDLAKQHGNAQRVYKIVPNSNLESKR